MKKMFKLFMCATVIVAGFTACSEEVTPIPDSSIKGETETGLLTVNFKEAAPLTRASGDKDDNATDAERKVRDVTILVFNTQGVCKVDTTINLSGLIPSTDATTPNKYKAVKIVVPLGNHNVYAGINLTSGDANKMKEVLGGKGTVNGVSKYVWFGTNESTPTVDAIKVLCKTDEFPMFASEAQSINIKAQPLESVDAVNAVTIPVDRMVAKVTVQKGDKFSGDNLKAAGAAFDGASVKWALGNLNGKIYPYGKVNFGTATFGQDPNFDYPDSLGLPAGKAYCAANFVNDFQTTDTDWNKWTGFTTVIDDNGKAVKDRTAKYAPENNSKRKRLGESTFAAIQVKFAPDSIFSYTAGDPAPVKVTGYTPNLSANVTYHAVEAGSMYYFKDKADAEAYAAFVKAPMKTYYGQYCFYHLMLGKGNDEKGITKRNHFYALTLNRITGIGSPTGEIDDVDNTSDNRALLDVTLAINAWALEEEGVDLEK